MRDKIISAVFICIFAVFGLGQWLLPDNELSFQERRKLAQMPDVSMNSIIYGTWMAQFDDYISDQFPARAKLRALRNTAELYFFQKLDAGGIYREKGSLYANARLPQNDAAVEKFAEKLLKMAGLFPESAGLYYCIIPDKSHYIDAGLHPVYDMELLRGTVEKLVSVSGLQEIIIDDTLSADSYYCTDLHWRQECLEGAAARIAEVLEKGMGSVVSEVFAEAVEKSFEPFYGAYYGPYAQNITPDTLNYLTGPWLENVTVTDLTTGAPMPLYAEDWLGGMDSYDIFLNGAAACIGIENTDSLSDKTLIVFRDSFAGPLIPLLAPLYKYIVMIDLRYMPADRVHDYVTADRPDILCLYGAASAWQSDSLRI